MEIRQAMGVPHGYGKDAAERLRQFVERAKGGVSLLTGAITLFT